MNKATSKKVWIYRLVFFFLLPFFFFLLPFFILALVPNKYGWGVATSATTAYVLFIWGIIKSRVTKAVYNRVFPEEARQEKTDSQNISKILENTKYDPRELHDWLQKLPYPSTIEEQKNVITKWYNERKIELKLKETLLIIISHKQESIEELSKRIKDNKDNDYKAALIKIKTYLEKNQAKEIADTYFDYQEKKKKEQIHLLKQSLKATQQLFDYGASKRLYGELVKLEPNAENHFNYAHFLHTYNSFNEAEPQYQRVLTIFRKLAQKNPETYLPYVAMTLNNLAVLQSDKNEFQKALENYKEAVEIYRKLAQKNPEAYGIDYAKMLIMGVDLFKQDKKELKEAREILSKYKNVPLAEWLMKKAEQIENNE